jgi:flagellar motor component MotA
MHLFAHFKRNGVALFEEKDAKELVDRVKQILEMIRNDKTDRKKKVAALEKHMDEEDLEFFMDNLEQVDKGVRHIMEISGFLLQNQSEVMSPYIG